MFPLNNFVCVCVCVCVCVMNAEKEDVMLLIQIADV